MCLGQLKCPIFYIGRLIEQAPEIMVADYKTENNLAGLKDFRHPMKSISL